MFSHRHFTVCTLSGSCCLVQVKSHLPLFSKQLLPLFEAFNPPSCPTTIGELVLCNPPKLPTKTSFIAHSSMSPMAVFASPRNIPQQEETVRVELIFPPFQEVGYITPSRRDQGGRPLVSFSGSWCLWGMVGIR